jgi:hypothetical protein
MRELRRYWFKFARLEKPSVLNLGCGVTAYSLDDAVSLIRERVFAPEPLPQIEQATEDVDVSTLDQGHVIPNMGLVTTRGIWFPKGYESFE